MAIRVRRVQVTHEQRCLLCREALGELRAHEVAVCPGCQAAAHLDCVDELGGGRCPTLGCAHSVTREQVLIPVTAKAVEGGLLLSLQETVVDVAALVGLALVLFLGLMGGVLVVVTQRLPLYSLLIPTLAPLGIYGLWQALRARR